MVQERQPYLQEYGMNPMGTKTIRCRDVQCFRRLRLELGSKVLDCDYNNLTVTLLDDHNEGDRQSEILRRARDCGYIGAY